MSLRSTNQEKELSGDSTSSSKTSTVADPIQEDPVDRPSVKNALEGDSEICNIKKVKTNDNADVSGGSECRDPVPIDDKNGDVDAGRLPNQSGSAFAHPVCNKCASGDKKPAESTKSAESAAIKNIAKSSDSEEKILKGSHSESGVDKGIFSLPSDFCPASLPKATDTNIFTISAKEKVKKPSGFLKSQFIEAPKTRKSLPEDAPVECGFSAAASLSYFDSEEWIPVGDGQVKLLKNRFVFIRKCFSTVILDFDYTKVEFTSKDDFILFTARSKKSTGKGFEFVNRNYRLAFNTSSKIEDFWVNIKPTAACES